MDEHLTSEAVVSEFDAVAVESRLGELPKDATPEQAAQHLFPHDEALRTEYLRREQELRDGLAQEHAEVEVLRPGPCQWWLRLLSRSSLDACGDRSPGR